MSGATIARVVIGVFGVLMLIGGIALALKFAGEGGVFFGFWLILSGIIVVIAVVVERTRYRSQVAEAAQLPPGPGGGETALPEPRFKPTSEVFVDPTTNLRMRVFVDSNTGERRYVAEG